ncbi:MAG: putative 2-O-methyltransferase NoeI [Promethearchaeota archaeon]|nr:MAG: putative 2-O-methyltransferase NoeI [Candidatus Lokiarchaeota archaeon]
MNIYDKLKLILPSEDAVIIEIGMHYGEDTLRILDIVDSCSYYGFEPDPRNIKKIQKLGIDKKIKFYPIAVSNFVGNTTMFLSSGSLHINDNWTGSSSILQPKEHIQHFPWCKFNECVDVHTTTLDCFTKDNNINFVDFIWMDAQGAEYKILSKGKETLQNTKYLYFEYYNSEMYSGQKTLTEILYSLGNNWEIIKQYPSDILLKNTKL